LLSLISVVLSIAIIKVKDTIILSIVVFSISFMTVMFLLLIICQRRFEFAGFRRLKNAGKQR
jgi:hypothetical protein